MRRFALTAAGCALALLWLGLTAPAQQITEWNPVKPKPLVFKPIDTTKALSPRNLVAPLAKPSTITKASPFQLRPPTKLSLGSWPPKTPNVFVLDKKNNPFQPNPPKGINLFDPPKKKKS